MLKDETGVKFKEMEAGSEAILNNEEPIVLRLDGNSFSKLTKKYFQKPYDERFEKAMTAAAKAVLEYCSGSYLAYFQSDEITIVLRPDESPFLGGRTQKIASLTSSIASLAFNQSLVEQGMEPLYAVFDCRAFNVPKDQVVPMLEWRQNDCFRNAIQSTVYHTLRNVKNMSGRQAHEKTKDMGVRALINFMQRELEIPLGCIWPNRLWGRLMMRSTKTQRLSEVLDKETFEELLAKGHIKEDETVTRQPWALLEETPIFDSFTLEL